MHRGYAAEAAHWPCGGQGEGSHLPGRETDRRDPPADIKQGRSEKTVRQDLGNPLRKWKDNVDKGWNV